MFNLQNFIYESILFNSFLLDTKCMQFEGKLYTIITYLSNAFNELNET